MSYVSHDPRANAFNLKATARRNELRTICAAARGAKPVPSFMAKAVMIVAQIAGLGLLLAAAGLLILAVFGS